MNIIVLYGGFSSEREVSLKSGKKVFQALKEIGHNAKLYDAKNEFEWLDEHGKLVNITKEDLKVDLIFNSLHGKYGEDGKLQAILESINIPYSGTGIFGSSLAIDKVKCNEILEKFDIDVPKTYVISNVKELEYLDLPFPLFVKPNDGGSSIASGKVNSKEELSKLVNEGLKFSDKILIQELLEGLELTCPVLGKGGHSIALPIGLIKTNNTFFDYNAKYNSSETEEIFPAPINEEQTKKIQEISVEVHKLLDCKGITRSDFIVTKDRIVFLEINTSPGMTDQSLCPKSAKSIGIDFPTLISKIINQN
jgi:D-alanine-D-alanine ligase